MNKLTYWLRQDIPDSATLDKIKLLAKYNIHTVCQEAKCPNINSCLKEQELTFLILGDICTRRCRFCAVGKIGLSALPVDNDEPYRIARAVKLLGLRYVVITSVTRDDLKDGGAAHFAKAIELIHALDKDIKVEALIPDFLGDVRSLRAVIDAGPCVIGHNIEAVKRLHRELKPESDYQLSLAVLAKIKEINPFLVTKSSIILGLGEIEEEVINTMQDLKNSNCDLLTLGQYLAPSHSHFAVKEFINLEKFRKYQEIGIALGFKAVLSGPKVRSSYKAKELYEEVAYV